MLDLNIFKRLKYIYVIFEQLTSKSFNLSIISIYLSILSIIYLSILLYIYLSYYLSILPIYLSYYLSIYLPNNLCPPNLIRVLYLKMLQALVKKTTVLQFHDITLSHTFLWYFSVTLSVILSLSIPLSLSLFHSLPPPISPKVPLLWQSMDVFVLFKGFIESLFLFFVYLVLYIYSKINIIVKTRF